MSKVKEEGGGSRLNTNKAATSRLFSSRFPLNFKFVSSQAKPENWIKLYASLTGPGLISQSLFCISNISLEAKVQALLEFQGGSINEFN